MRTTVCDPAHFHLFLGSKTGQSTITNISDHFPVLIITNYTMTPLTREEDAPLTNEEYARSIMERQWRDAKTQKARNQILKPYLGGSSPLNAWHSFTSFIPQGRDNDRFYSSFTLNKLCRDVDLARCASGEIPVAKINKAMRKWQKRLKDAGCTTQTLPPHPFRATRGVSAVKQLLDQRKHVLIINPPRFTIYSFVGTRNGTIFSLEEDFDYYIEAKNNNGSERVKESYI